MLLPMYPNIATIFDFETFKRTRKSIAIYPFLIHSTVYSPTILRLHLYIIGSIYTNTWPLIQPFTYFAWNIIASVNHPNSHVINIRYENWQIFSNRNCFNAIQITESATTNEYCQKDTFLIGISSTSFE